MGDSAIAPVDPNASPNTIALLTYLDNLQQNGDTGRVLSGSTLSGYTNYQSFIEATFDSVGVYPAILQVNPYKHAKDREATEVWNVGADIHRSSSWSVPVSYNWAKDGGIVWWLHNPANPFTGESHRSLVPAGRDFSEVWTTGTKAYQVYHEDLEMLAIQLKKLAEYDIPVVIRFIGECDNEKGQWANPNRNLHTWDDFKQFWKHTIEYIRNEMGVHNVLWCLETVGEYTESLWQEDYIDVAGLQEQVSNDTSFLYPFAPYRILTGEKINTKKPLIYGQWLMREHRDKFPIFDYTQATRFFKSVETRVVGCIPWDGYGNPIKTSHSPVHHINAYAYYHDELMINRGDNPIFGNCSAPEMPIEYTPTGTISKGLNFNFNDNQDYEGWTVQNEYSSNVYQKALHVLYFGDNPAIKKSDINIPAEEFPTVSIRMRNNSLADTIRFDWQKDNNDIWYSVYIPLSQMPVNFEVKCFDLSAITQWSGTITGIRFALNPDHLWGGSEIDYIALGKESDFITNTIPVLSEMLFPPTAPINLTASEITETSCKLIWGASTDKDSIAAYDIFIDDVLKTSVKDTFAVINDLETATSYSFTVKARDIAGNLSLASNALTVTTLDKEIPIGISRTKHQLNLSIYPNPSKGILNINTEQETVAEIYDLSGHLMKQFRLLPGINSVSVNKLVNGMYVVAIGGVEVRRFLKL